MTGVISGVCCGLCGSAKRERVIKKRTAGGRARTRNRSTLPAESYAMFFLEGGRSPMSRDQETEETGRERDKKEKHISHTRFTSHWHAYYTFLLLF